MWELTRSYTIGNQGGNTTKQSCESSFVFYINGRYRWRMLKKTVARTWHRIALSKREPENNLMISKDHSSIWNETKS